MKVLVLISIVSTIAAASQEPEEQIREKRGLLGAPLPYSYSSHYIHHAPSVAVSYHAPLPAVKVIQPLPITKVVAPAVSYTKIAYPSIVPFYGYGHGLGYAHSFAHGYGHGFGHFH